jgi:hypothetical protein
VLFVIFGQACLPLAISARCCRLPRLFVIFGLAGCECGIAWQAAAAKHLLPASHAFAQVVKQKIGSSFPKDPLDINVDG